MASWPARILGFAVCASAFSLAYTQAPLYYSNQNQYFLHGMAHAGVGHLADDWLAGTADPTPVFSSFVAFVARFLDQRFFYVFYVLLFGVYAWSMISLFASLAHESDTRFLRWSFAAALFAVHSGLSRWASYRLVGWDYPWYFQSGLAGQYVLGGMLQPSTFGVLLLASIALHLRERERLAVVAAVVAGIVHSTYLPAAGLLTAVYAADGWKRGRPREAVALAVFAFVAVVPSLAYAAWTFRPSSAEAFAESQRLLARVRIPHHCLPRLWCDGIAVGQIAWIALGMALAWRSRLFPIMAVVVVASTALTFLQIALDSDSLALLFPWRTSAAMVPLSTTIVLARLILGVRRSLSTSTAAAVSAALIASLAVSGVVLMWTRAAYRNNDAEVPLYEFVKARQAKGDVYLLPARIPKLASATRGSFSSDFKPLAERKNDARMVPIDFQRFRLATGMPIFVDFKSIPYRDLDVLEWHRRLVWNERIYEDGNLSRDGIVEELDREGITHIVTVRGSAVRNAGLEVVYEDEHYAILRRAKP